MKLHTLKGYIQNIFIAEYADKLLLLDGTARADINKVKHFVEHTLQRSLNDIKLIVVTHMHPDHAGGAKKLSQLSGAPIACHPEAQIWYAGLGGRMAHLIDLILLQYVAKRTKSPLKNPWYNPILKADIVLSDNQTLPYFEDWQVLYTSGHTDHDISLVHHKNKCIYIADLLVKVKGKLHYPYPLSDPIKYKQSLNCLIDFKGFEIFYAHLAQNKLDIAAVQKVLNMVKNEPLTYRQTTLKFLKSKLPRLDASKK